MPTRRKLTPAQRSEILLANRHACCVCQDHKVQIHHIDSDPSNNEIKNLAVLCLKHHDQATMQAGLSSKLNPRDVREYKRTWEARCATDTLALARSRMSYYVTLYKNPPRIHEAIGHIDDQRLMRSVDEVAEWIITDHEKHSADPGFKWQEVPLKNNSTRNLLVDAARRELWPSSLPAVSGHPEDANFPHDRSPPNGMIAFHGYDKYCQLLVRILVTASETHPLENLISTCDVSSIQFQEGTLIHFEGIVKSEKVSAPRSWKTHPTSKLTLDIGQPECVIKLTLRTMYVFSDTSADNLEHCRVRGVGILGSAFESDGKTQIQIIPLIMGMGAAGQADESGFAWKANHYPIFNRT